MQTDTNSVKIVFGDLKTIIKIAKNAPHIIENTHECNCTKCLCYDVEGYECSVCGEEEHYISKFGKKGEYKCPNKKCGEDLLSPEEYRWNLQNKMKMYNPFYPL